MKYIVLALLFVASFAYADNSLTPTNVFDGVKETVPGENPFNLRQGGETIALATVIPSLPYTDIGTTSGYVDNYNEVYYKPAKSIIDDLYEKKLLSKDKPLDEKLEFDVYEMWHHEGRRARFGAAMMAPDYAWWHGFYELKKRFMEIEEQAEQLLKSGKPAKIFEMKGTGGDTTKPSFEK